MNLLDDSIDPFRQSEVPPPCPQPLEAAVEAGLLGVCANHSYSPSPVEVAAMTEEHARELFVTLQDLKHLNWCLKYNVNPRNGCQLGAGSRWEELEKSMQTNVAKLSEHYEGCLDAYVSAFGFEAASSLDRWVRALPNVTTFQTNPFEVQKRFF